MAAPAAPDDWAESPLRGTTVLVADDDRLTRRLVREALERQGCTVETCEDGQAAVERAGQGGIDLVLLDVLMPKLTGLEACRLLKAMTGDSFLPVVLVTVKTDTASRVEGLKLGADDYVCKPFDEAELVARLAAMMRIKRLHDHVVEARAQLERLSVQDELTGLYNYRYLSARIGEEFKRAERYHDPMACFVLDIDHLAVINERGGRVLGDRVLCGVAEVTRRSLRDVDVVARFGGDELLAVLPSTHFAGSVTAAERIWHGINERLLSGDFGREVPVSVSIGIALYPSRDVKTKEALLRAADAALYEAKRDGGNRICVFQQQGCVYAPSRKGRSGSERPPGDGSEPTGHDGA